MNHPSPVYKSSLSATDFNPGEVTLGRREPRANCPIFMSRYWLSLEKDSGLIAMSVSSVASEAPVAESQSLTVSSSDADATSLPSGEKATALTGPEWPVSR